MSKEKLGLPRGMISQKAGETMASIAMASCRISVFEYKKTSAFSAVEIIILGIFAAFNPT